MKKVSLLVSVLTLLSVLLVGLYSTLKSFSLLLEESSDLEDDFLSEDFVL
ncbi:MAG: hypothetical protein ACKOW9_06195 [Candidatus Paceibacterota bacterium]